MTTDYKISTQQPSRNVYLDTREGVISNSLCNLRTGLDRPWRFQNDEIPRFQDNRHTEVVKLSALRTGSFYPPGNIRGTNFCYRLSAAAGRIKLMKNFNDTIRNRTRFHPACNAVSQPNAPQRATTLSDRNTKFRLLTHLRLVWNAIHEQV